jgi:phosphatidylethanolamine/phosphatidyl-N-methylethanolamine N-methyltransferase
MKNQVAFLMAYLRNPSRVGAIAPASRALVRSITAEANRHESHVLIEIGAGTGAITRALVQAGRTNQRLIVYERDPQFAQLLRKRWPDVEVYNHCASAVNSLQLDEHATVTVVSSLPLISMPQNESQKCIAAMLALISRQPQSRLIQYTYASAKRRPFKDIPAGWRWRRVSSVWANLPPANVWSLEQAI